MLIVNCSSIPSKVDGWCGMKLPNKLIEISGLTAYQEQTVLAVQDEDGKIYRIWENGKVEKLTEFTNEGDFEGITTTPSGDIWVLRSDAVLFQVTKHEGEYRTQKHRVPFLEDSESEGLCYDKATHSLFIAVKENAPGLSEKIKAIYRYSLSSHQLNKTPAFTINTKEFHKRYGRSSFAPSAISWDAKYQFLYVLSGRSQQIAVLNKSGKVVNGFNLDKDDHRQPEGLQYLNNTFLVANEGSGKSARIRCWQP